MELKVVNALSRDVEREQLNKILKYISDKLSSSSTVGVTEEQVRRWIADSTTYTSSPVVRPPTSGPPAINPQPTIEEAPYDSLPYWRQDGQWQNVPFPLLALAYLSPSGLASYNEETFEWNARYIEVDASDLAIKNPDGVTGNPSISLATISAVAGETIHGGRAVKLEGGVASHPRLSVTEDSLKVVGVAHTSGSTGSTIEVKTNGRVTDTSYTLSSGLVFCGDFGVITQTPPSSGWTVALGNVINSSTFQIDIKLPIIRI